ncbi:MAG: hypothetical protein K2Y21_01375 [Phycisphaerales bacterium]|nr:hypothetical protein [Phycisphaerales bacterium]
MGGPTGATVLPGYKIVEIPLLPAGLYAEALGVNGRGQIVGRCFIEDAQAYSGFVYDLPSNTLTDLGTLGAGEPHGAWAINNDRFVVATADAGGGANAGLLISPFGVRTQINGRVRFGPPGGSEARSINSGGTIAGSATFDCSFSQSTLFGCGWGAGGALATAYVSSAAFCADTRALSINDAGFLVGWTNVDIGTPETPLMLKRPVLVNTVQRSQTNLPTFTSTTEMGIANAIGNTGVICGVAQDASDAGRVHPVAWVGGVPIKLPSLGGGFVEGSAALSVNAAGDVVGRSGEGSASEAVVWLGAEPTARSLASLTSPPQGPHPTGWKLQTANAISDIGLIVGKGLAPGDASGNTKAFVAVPCNPVLIQTPETQTTCLLGTVPLRVSAIGAGTLTYQWRRNGVNMVDGPLASGALVAGANTANMIIAGFNYADEGTYDVVITGDCGGVVSGTATVLICASDLNCDNVVNDGDFSVFAPAYDLLDCLDPAMPFGCPSDINRDGFVDDLDFTIFVQAYDQLLCGGAVQ